MKALVLNGLDNRNKFYSNLKKHIEDEINKSGYKLKWINLVEKHIEYCNGCGYCSNTRPGVCCKYVDMQEIFPKMANSELLIFICSISFGGYNSQLKKIVDRYSPLGLPTYTVHNNELHHPCRYSKPNLFMSMGVLNEEKKQQKETFKLVSERTAISCFVSNSTTIILNKNQNKSEIIEKIGNGFNKIGMIS